MKAEQPEDEEPYCIECGEYENLAYHRTVSNGDEYQCKSCKTYFLYDPPKEDVDWDDLEDSGLDKPLDHPLKS